MKRILFFVVMVTLAFGGCKSKKQLPQSQYTSDPEKEQKVFAVPGSETEEEVKDKPEEKKEEAVAEREEPIAMRKEQVSFTSQEDKAENESNDYFVILGSFSFLNNAKNYRGDLLDQGFTPIILHSETGYYRVCVNSYQNESEARSRVADIRQTYPKYSDVWLLIKD
jgi:cell division protein FtsN